MATPTKSTAPSAEFESWETVFAMTTSEFEMTCKETIANRKPGPVRNDIIVIDENDRIVKEYDDGRLKYIPEGSIGNDVPISYP